MGAPSNTFITTVLNLIKSDTPHVALYTTNPTAGDVGTELSTGGYARLPITFGSITINSGTGSMSNTGDIVFSSLASANVTHFAVRDALTGGEMIVYGTLSSAAAVVTGDEIRIPAGGLTVTFGA